MLVWVSFQKHLSEILPNRVLTFRTQVSITCATSRSSQTVLASWLVYNCPPFRSANLERECSIWDLIVIKRKFLVIVGKIRRVITRWQASISTKLHKGRKLLMFGSLNQRLHIFNKYYEWVTRYFVFTCASYYFFLFFSKGKKNS